MIIKGKVHKFADNVNTDEIIASRYLNATDPKELGSHCMEILDKDFSKNVVKGDIIVAGRNFGCGSSRQHAPLAIKGVGISCVIALSFARIFYRNCLNLGLPILEIKGADKITPGSELEIDLASGRIVDTTNNNVFQAAAYPEFMRSIINAGGLINWLRMQT
ncbi:MAG: 3-isopropylmalate dehydratase small subunit [Candidatus Omnitrophica bacterium]|nr:3-isopropylmalate dehydratase small subunit [Candidatus Omnitrophota bacterium]